jgi:3-oxoacyl-[acyl-carrier-protein] synthase II
MSLRRVVVTGMGALTPLGSTVTDYWTGLTEGRSGAGPITRFDASKFKTRFACEVKNFDPLMYFDRKEARKMDPFAQFAMGTAIQAVEDSELLGSTYDPDRVGVIWGSGIGGILTFQEEVMNFYRGDGTPRFNPFFIPKMISDIASGLISIRYGFRGPNFSVVSACATSTNAIIDAFNYIRLGMADVIVTGGSEAAITEAGVGGFNACKALSENNDDYAHASRPYDKLRDGFVLGEGGGALILEDLEHAIARGAKIYAEVIGCGMSGDAHHITDPHPEGAGIIPLMKNALRDAKITAEQVDYINTHGTSTPKGDIGEIRAITKVFGEHVYSMNLSSTKSMTGHLLGGAGAIESIASIMAINTGIIPPTINHQVDDEELDPRLNFTFNKAQKRDITIALSNTFGFGGHNASVIYKKYQG